MSLSVEVRDGAVDQGVVERVVDRGVVFHGLVEAFLGGNPANDLSAPAGGGSQVLDRTVDLDRALFDRQVLHDGPRGDDERLVGGGSFHVVERARRG